MRIISLKMEEDRQGILNSSPMPASKDRMNELMRNWEVKSKRRLSAASFVTDRVHKADLAVVTCASILSGTR
jgi:hypothetical protein